MNMNKKGFNMVLVMSSVIILVFFGFLFSFFSNFFFNAGDTILLEVENIGLNMANTSNFSPTTTAIITSARTDYNDVYIPYDIFFFIAVLVLFISNIIFSFKSRKAGIFSVFGVLSIGIMFFLALISILEDIRLWLFNSFIYPLFGISTISTPLLDSFYNNFPFIAFLWIVVNLLVNQFDSDTFKRNSGRLEE